MVEKITPIEERIVEYLSLNPRRNARRIKWDLEKPYNNYANIIRALSRMSKKGWLIVTEGRGENKILVKFYRLSSLGIGVALEKNPEDKLLKTLELYKENIPESEIVSQLAGMLEPRLSVKLLRATGRTIQDDAPKADQPDKMSLNAVNGLDEFSRSEIEELLKAARLLRQIRRVTFARSSLEMQAISQGV